LNKCRYNASLTKEKRDKTRTDKEPSVYEMRASPVLQLNIRLYVLRSNVGANWLIPARKFFETAENHWAHLWFRPCLQTDQNNL